MNPVRTTTTVIIGGGQAGLAMSRCLSERSIDHVVLERGEVANTWRTERWDSLRLLTPNWQSRLPGFHYKGNNTNGYREVSELISFLEQYAKVISAPIETNTTVNSVKKDNSGYRIVTDQGNWHCRTLVLASGACNIAQVPAVSEIIPPQIMTFDSIQYRNPNQLPDGRILVVGASATGTQLAEEIHLSGRPVLLSVGEHIRAPRIYRGHDLYWWMDVTGILDESYDEVEDIVRARKLPSLQLTGTSERKTLDLNALTKIGVELVGSLVGISNGHAQFSGSLHNQCALSDLKMDRLLNTIDVWANENNLNHKVGPPQRFVPTRVQESPPLSINLKDGNIKGIVWATGYRPDYSWLELPVFDRKGQIKHDGGKISSSPGMYILGLQFLRRRKSALLDGVGNDARFLSAHLQSYLDGNFQ